MGTKGYRHSLRFKITVSLLLSVVIELAITSWLRYLSFRRLLTDSLGSPMGNAAEIIETQLAAYVRSRLILSVSAIAVILLISELLMSRVVVSRLKQFLRVVRQIGAGKLDASVRVRGNDEIAELAEAFNQMTGDLKRQTDKLSVLNTLAATVSQSLNLKEVLRTALDEVLGLTHLRAGWIVLRNGDGQEFHLAATRGLPHEAALVHAQCDWTRCVCAGVFESGQPQIFREQPQNPCPAARYLEAEGLVFRSCVPLLSKDRVLGVMSLVGVTPNGGWVFAQDSLETLTAIGRQVGVAIENASLYEELRHTEALRRQLMERGIDLQEEERKRIARELHDQTSQRLTSILMTLGALGEVESLTEVRAHVGDLRDMAAQTLEEVHDLALELRPRLLDDLGLLAGLQHCLGEFRDKYRVPADFQVLGLDHKRLPSRVETALYRIAQEALANVARHAKADNVGVLLENRDTSVILIVEDDGRGFDVSHMMGAHVHEGNLGLYGMRERATLLGGTLTIESTPEEGTSIFVEIPLDGGGRQL